MAAPWLVWRFGSRALATLCQVPKLPFGHPVVESAPAWLRLGWSGALALGP